MGRIYNFSAGPGILPEEVLQQAKDEMLNYRDKGLSVMEMSHRSKDFLEIFQETESTLRRLMHIPDHYKVLFLQGGASTQFAMIPLNLMNKNKKADFVISGHWAKKAYSEAKKYGDAQIIASSEDKLFSYIPDVKAENIRQDADYVHICINNTIYGTRFKPQALPDTGEVTLVGDMSSNILSEVYDVERFGLIYAGAQKNMGPAGVTLVIIREDLIQSVPEMVLTMLQYKIQDEANSMYNTPPCYAIYICGLVYQWLEKMGGIPAIEEINQRKAKKLYDFLDNSDFYHGIAEKESRSLMNIPFVCADSSLNDAFIKEAQAYGLFNLKGHRSIGGMRASIYNAMPEKGVDTLIAFMKNFAMHNR